MNYMYFVSDFRKGTLQSVMTYTYGSNSEHVNEMSVCLFRPLNPPKEDKQNKTNSGLTDPMLCIKFVLGSGETSSQYCPIKHIHTQLHCGQPSVKQGDFTCTHVSIGL